MTVEPFGLYIHWPFCLSKCPYCDFNSHVPETPIDQNRWCEALLREMEVLSARIPNARLGSIFFGGGTPSLMAPRSTGRLIEQARSLWPAVPDLEVTLEANPTSAEGAAFDAFAKAGVNRLSLGVQALNDVDLKRLGRRHDVKEALSALDIAGQIFSRVSFDLIYARQEQDLESWEDELARALDLGTGHLSLYQLTVEPHTPFFTAQADGRLKLPGTELSREFYDRTQAICMRAGLPAYEISNHARPGEESRHNLGYWRGADYLGIGPGAHSRLQAHALANIRTPKNWLVQVEAEGHGLEHDTALSAHEQAEEFLLMGLRLAEGLDLEALARRTGHRIAPSRIQELGNDGLVKLEIRNAKRSTKGTQLIVTPEGRPVLNPIIQTFAAALYDNPPIFNE